MKKISATRLRDMLEQVVVHNDHNLFQHVKPVPPVISYAKSDRHQYARWRVWRPGFKVNPNAHWHDGGAKTFLVASAQKKAEQFEAAKNWASEKYGYTIDEWEKTPYGSWVPKDALEAALRHHLPHLFVEEGDDTTLIESARTRVDTGDDWYRVVGANVAVFIQATDAEDAKKRVMHMINRLTMDCSLELHITKRDPEVG